MSGATAHSIEKNDALVIVDVQNDFLPSGALPVDDGDAVIPVIN
jgi:nicotinamidase/pyrazinamidase